eukprot:CAMPEP_0205939806 /NCGR_PEP_ID=MMETSP1325-20131115/50713_1 /ASSEMBLY_ACC=CAM_ASM_000708 /TAXON_ID=236786 /ORGANISM="Florenciella sp., Strain RCC1007" /LENGTH=40 /DNA_ID= /DNA_START= /DNA_END= /DNA_ORIENTATION=
MTSTSASVISRVFLSGGLGEGGQEHRTGQRGKGVGVVMAR